MAHQRPAERLIDPTLPALAVGLECLDDVAIDPERDRDLGAAALRPAAAAPHDAIPLEDRGPIEERGAERRRFDSM